MIVVAASVVLLAAGWWKIRHRPLFRGALRAQGLHVWVSLLSWSVPGAELALGIGLLVVRPWIAVPVSLFGLLLLGYVTYGFVRLRGKPCGCLSAAETFGVRSFVRAAVIVAAGPAALFTSLDAFALLIGVAIGLCLILPARVLALR
jgi:hypothetical protein